MPEETTSQSPEDVPIGVDDHPGDQPRVSIPPPAQPATVPQQPPPHAPPSHAPHAPPPSDYITRAEMVSMLANMESRLMA